MCQALCFMKTIFIKSLERSLQKSFFRGLVYMTPDRLNAKGKEGQRANCWAKDCHDSSLETRTQGKEMWEKRKYPHDLTKAMWYARATSRHASSVSILLQNGDRRPYLSSCCLAGQNDKIHNGVFLPPNKKIKAKLFGNNMRGCEKQRLPLQMNTWDYL